MSICLITQITETVKCSNLNQPDNHDVDDDDDQDGDDEDDDGLGRLTAVVRQRDNRRPFSCLSHIVRKLTQTLKIIVIIIVMITIFTTVTIITILTILMTITITYTINAALQPCLK